MFENTLKGYLKTCEYSRNNQNYFISKLVRTL